MCVLAKLCDINRSGPVFWDCVYAYILSFRRWRLIGLKFVVLLFDTAVLFEAIFIGVSGYEIWAIR